LQCIYNVEHPYNVTAKNPHLNYLVVNCHNMMIGFVRNVKIQHATNDNDMIKPAFTALRS